MLPESSELRAWNEEARAAAEEVIEVGGASEGDADLAQALARVNELSERVNEVVLPRDEAPARARPHRRDRRRRSRVAVRRDPRATPSASRASASSTSTRTPICASAYEGFTLLARVDHGQRDAPRGRRAHRAGRHPRLLRRRGRSASLASLGAAFARSSTCSSPRARSRGELADDRSRKPSRRSPKRVYVSFDIDGLDPALCPHTGTPVPGGLSFHEASALLGAVAQSGRRIVGFDLNEVAPGPDDDDEWDANVGARLLYKLIGWTLLSQRLIEPPRLP